MQVESRPPSPEIEDSQEEEREEEKEEEKEERVPKQDICHTLVW